MIRSSPRSKRRCSDRFISSSPSWPSARSGKSTSRSMRSCSPPSPPRARPRRSRPSAMPDRSARSSRHSRSRSRMTSSGLGSRPARGALSRTSSGRAHCPRLRSRSCAVHSRSSSSPALSRRGVMESACRRLSPSTRPGHPRNSHSAFAESQPGDQAGGAGPRRDGQPAALRSRSGQGAASGERSLESGRSFGCASQPCRQRDRKARRIRSSQAQDPHRGRLERQLRGCAEASHRKRPDFGDARCRGSGQRRKACATCRALERCWNCSCSTAPRPGRSPVSMP